MESSDTVTIHSTNYRLSCRQQPHCIMDTETEASTSGTESDVMYKRPVLPRKSNYKKNGCNYENCIEDMLVDDCRQLSANSNNSNNFHPPPKSVNQIKQLSPPPMQQQSPPYSATPITTGHFAATAVNIFRNCCGGNFFTESSTGITINNNTRSNKNYCNKHQQNTIPISPTGYTPHHYFNALMKKLHRNQIDPLLKAVKSRKDSTKGAVITQPPSCILIPKALILDKEPFLITCQLFFWPSLKNAMSLKRLPDCRTADDPVYVCCNPLHWCRIVETETAPPPYQQSIMQRLRNDDVGFGENSHYRGNSSITTGSNNSLCSNNKMQPGLCVRIPESLTTDGEDRRSCSLTWCQVAYWEMSQRVGALFLAKKSSVNIFSENSETCINANSDGMCLKNLAEMRTTPCPEDVQYTRQKIGLGVTLKQATDGVWLFNRSTVPIFVYSPTLSESCFRVCRVDPGDCIKAFDSDKAHNLMYPLQFPSAQTGPMDIFSMRISFAKGWGYTYKRQDIIRCPCWLEVIFSQR